MKLSGCLAIIAALSAAAARPAAAQEDAIRLQPSSDWSLEYADQHCALRRSFGEEVQRTFLEIRLSYPNTSFRVSVVSERFPVGALEPVTHFEPDTGETQAHLPVALLQGTNRIGGLYGDSLHLSAMRSDDALKDDQGQIIWSDAARDAREREITAYNVSDLFFDDLTLQTGEMHAPMNALRDCVNDLLRTLGVDPTAQATLSREPEPVNFVRMFRNVQQAGANPTRAAAISVHVRLVIDPSGEVAGCYLHDIAADPERHEALCAAYRRSEFEPALDASGTAVTAVWGTVMSWVAVR